MKVHQACQVISPILQEILSTRCATLAFGARGRSGCAFAS